MEHNLAPLGEIHIPHNWEHVNAAARAAEVITDIAEVGKKALDLETGEEFRLVSVDPAVWAAVPTDWANVLNKPTEFAPSTHSHSWSSVTDKPTEFAPSTHSHSWSSVTDKPAEFTPSAHSHTASDVTGLEAAVLGTDLAGFIAGAGEVAETDTVLGAIQKLAAPYRYVTVTKPGTLIANEAAKNKYIPSRTVTLTHAEAWLMTPNTGGTVVIEVYKGVSLAVTLTIPNDGTGMLALTDITDISLTTSDYLTIKVTQVGLTIPGSTLNVRFKGA